jgi:hypothetical protein
MIMTTDEIKQAIHEGRLVTMRDDPTLCLCLDLFGNLVVVSRQTSDEPTPVRLATTEDIENAV